MDFDITDLPDEEPETLHARLIQCYVALDKVAENENITQKQEKYLRSGMDNIRAVIETVEDEDGD